MNLESDPSATDRRCEPKELRVSKEPVALSRGNRSSFRGRPRSAFLSRSCIPLRSTGRIEYIMADDAPIEVVRTIADVQREDAEFFAAASQESFDEAAEAAALKNLMSGTKAEAACSALNQSSKWTEAQQIWSTLGLKDDQALGASVRKVVESLEAPHLKPTGIASRLDNGVNATCFGLFSLLQNLNAGDSGNAL